MSENIINGNTIASAIRAEIKEKVEELVKQNKPSPGITVILIGDRKDSSTYVRMKEKACQEVGFISKTVRFPQDTPQDEIINSSK